MSIVLGVLASGRGSNFLAIQEAIETGRLDARIAVLLSDRREAPALQIAAEHGIEQHYLPYDRQDRKQFEQRAADLMEEHGCELIILAGFMRLLTPYLVNRFEGRILNIHPALLPSFKGLDAQRQALEAGVKISGCTVHVVTEDMDAGPIVGQRAVAVYDDDTEDSLAARILEQEHKLFPEAIAAYAETLQEDRNAQ